MKTKYDAADAERIIKAEDDLANLTPQGLRTVRPFYHGLKKQPDDFRQESPAGVLFYNLQLCYQHQKNISEGMVGDIIWGFRQSGIPGNIVMDGFTELYRLKYLDFTDERGTHLLGSFNEKSWYKWTARFLILLLDTPEQTIAPHIVDSIRPEDKTVDDLAD